MDTNALTNDPFISKNESGGEFDPLHAVNSSQLTNDARIEETDAAPFAIMGGTAEIGSMEPILGEQEGNGIRNVSNSLFERIQQQKNQHLSEQPSAKADSQPAPFGYPMADDMTYATSNPMPAQQPQMQVKVPQYSATPRPDPYDNNINYSTKMMDVLSNMGSAAIDGAKYLAGGRLGPATTSTPSGRMGEMDYQRESLLMDPHDLEDRSVPVSTYEPSTETMPAGMVNGLGAERNNVAVREQGSSVGGYVTQFLVDVKDLFLSAPRHVQTIVVGIFLFITWLLFS